MSQKGVADNYLPLSGGILTGELNADKGLQATGAKIYGGASITGATDIYDLTVHDFKTKSDDETEGISIDQTSIQYYNTAGGTGWTFSGISDSTGTSSTIAASQKCLADNYLAKSDAIYSTTDLTAGTSPLTTGSFYFVYE